MADAALSGLLKCQPCAALQPMTLSAAAISADSTPSATESMSSARTRSTMDCTITSSSADSSSREMNDGSIFTSLTGSRLSRTREE